MNTNKFFIIPFLLFLLIFFIKLPLFASIIIEGKKADVELNDLLLSREKVNNETDVKKLCVEITERYHSNGYTAFKIINAVIKKDGTLHLNFSDPIVEKIIVSGAARDNERIADDINLKDKAFNENILKNSISNIKKNYSISRAHIELKRTVNGNIDIYIIVERRRFSGSIMAGSDPLYGALTALTVAYDDNPSAFSIKYDTTADIRKTSYSKADINYGYSFNEANFLNLFSALRYEEKNIYSDDFASDRFNEKLFESEAGLIFKKRAVLFSITAVLSRVNYSNLSDFNNDYYFPGVYAGLQYNNKFFSIDPADFTTLEIKTGYIWNPIEKKMALRNNMKGYMVFPVEDILSLSVYVNSCYTSENNTLFHEYVFDRVLPLRNSDYTTSQWRNVVRPGLLFNMYSRFLYLSPEYICGFYSDYDEIKFIQAPSVRWILKSEFFSAEIAYAVECGDRIRDGILTLEANAVF